MKIPLHHRWHVPTPRAKQIQHELAGKVLHRGPINSCDRVRTIAGVDVSYGRNNRAYVSIVVCNFPDCSIIQKISLSRTFKHLMPYIPGFLSFREAPPVIAALKRLQGRPDVFIFDGQGIAHPRRLGLAAHLGVLLNVPSIGCAKSVLYGTYTEPPPGLKGAYTFLKNKETEIIGIALRTRIYVKPVIVSIGHLIDLDTAGDIVLKCCKHTRIPEPIRIAHNGTQQLRSRHA